MQPEPTIPSVSPESLERQHESATPRVRWALCIAGLTAIMVAGCLGVVWLFMDFFSSRRPLDNTIAERGIVVAPNLNLLTRFPAPNLQVNPHEDLVALRAREEAELTHYGWVDRAHGVVRIPIDRAMQLIAERGLPTRTPGQQAQTGPSSYDLIRERATER